MKRLRLGIMMEENDALVLARIEAEGIMEDWKEAMAKAAADDRDAMMIYDTPKERWVINQSTMPGDCGYTLITIPRAVVYHPMTLAMWRRVATMRGVVPRLSEWRKVHPKRKDRN